MKLSKGITTALLAGILVTGLTACEKPGPTEKAGKAIDDAASSVADSAKDAEKSVEKELKD